MGEWYAIGLYAGAGVAIGVLLAGLLATARWGAPVAAVAAAAGGAAVGLLVAEWHEAVSGGLGGLLGAAGAVPVARGAAGGGGTRGGTAALLGAGAAVLAGLAFVPALGYVEAVVVPALAVRLRRRGGRRYAGLRILARD
jgi:hypothetical protein